MIYAQIDPRSSTDAQGTSMPWVLFQGSRAAGGTIELVLQYPLSCSQLWHRNRLLSANFWCTGTLVSARAVHAPLSVNFLLCGVLSCKCDGEAHCIMFSRPYKGERQFSCRPSSGDEHTIRQPGMHSVLSHYMSDPDFLHNIFNL